MDSKNTSLIATKARETFENIKILRKTMPQFTKQQRDAFEVKKKELENQWWEDVRIYMNK